ncbi:MAG: hypothetical protein GPJ54_09400 [Candidatus Heimdallarchaeota archaeon]|nr:hypothetical protein [Candidatus Heimdallarchaeota archaeon]
MVIFLLFSLGLVLIMGYNFYQILKPEDGYYYETFSLEVKFNQPSEIQIIIPPIKVDGELTPVLQSLYDQMIDNVHDNLDVKLIEINDSTFIEITGITKEISLHHRIDLPKIKKDSIGYEGYLFDHYLIDESVVEGNRRWGDYSTYLLIKGTDAILEGFKLEFKAITNLCDGYFVLPNDQDMFFGKTVELGEWYIVDNYYFHFSCA